jgi:hypothetical protein
MPDFLVRRRVITLATLATAVAVIGCGEDKRVKELNVGITRDSAVSIIAQNYRGASDSFPNVYTREKYLIDAKNYEILYFTPNNEKAGKDSVPYSKLTPLVFVDNILVAKGWPALDSIGAAHKIPVPNHK